MKNPKATCTLGFSLRIEYYSNLRIYQLKTGFKLFWRLILHLRHLFLHLFGAWHVVWIQTHLLSHLLWIHILDAALLTAATK